MAAAAKSAGVKHVIWSTLEDTRKWVPLSDDRMPTLYGRYKVPHFDSKGSADHVLHRRRHADHLPAHVLLLGQLHPLRDGPKKGPDGKLALTLPMADKKLPGIAVEDIGRCAYGILKKGGEYVGKTVGIAGEHLTGTQMAAAFTRALGKDVRYNAVPADVYRGFGFPGAEDLGNMFQFKCDFEDYYCGARSLAVSRSLNPALQTFDAWLVKNAGRIPLE